MQAHVRKALIDLLRYPHDESDPFADMDRGQLWMITHDLATELIRSRITVDDDVVKFDGETLEVSPEQRAAIVENFIKRENHETCMMIPNPVSSDSRCGKPAIGSHEKTVRVCADCATNLIHEQFEIAFDVQLPPRIGDRYRFVNDARDKDVDLTVVRVTGPGPDDLVLFNDRTHSKQKHLHKAIKLT